MRLRRKIAWPATVRFIQPDTIVPEPGDPQALNRYSYVLNNPLRYTDPTGHYLCEDETGACDSPGAQATQIILVVQDTYGISVGGDWTRREANSLRLAFLRMERGVADQLGIATDEAQGILANVFSGGTIARGSNSDPLHAIGTLIIRGITRDTTANPGGSTYAPYYTIGSSGYVQFPGISQPTAFIWDAAFSSRSDAANVITHESGHLIDLQVSSGMPDLLLGTVASNELLSETGSLNLAPTDYGKSNTYELFAASWYAYVSKPSALSSKATRFFNRLLYWGATGR